MSEEEEIILVPMKRKEWDDVQYILAYTPVWHDKAESSMKIIDDCLEGKEGLCKEEIRELYECMCNTYDPFPEHIQKLYEEKLKRWIQ